MSEKLVDIAQALDRSLFKMDEFDVAPTGEQPIPAAVSQIIKKSVDLGDGLVEFEGRDHDEIIDKITQAQRARFEQQMLASDQEEYEQPFEPQEVAPLTADQLSAIMLSFRTDPVTAVVRLFEEGTGIPIEQLRAGNQAAIDMQARAYADAVGKDFVRRHVQLDEDGYPVSADYYPCLENADKMIRFLHAKNAPLTPENFEYAFSSLKAINALKPIPDGYFGGDEDPNSQAPTALSGQDSSYPAGQVGLDGNDAIKWAWEAPIDQLEAKLRAASRNAR